MQRKSFSHSPKRGGNVFRNSTSSRYAKPQRRGQYINPDRFVNKATIVAEAERFTPKHRFVDFNFSEALKKNIDLKGYLLPTPIQDEAIPPVLAGKDLVGLANTGTGKTAAFILPIINKLQLANGHGLALIIVPTRELATQIEEEFRGFARQLNLYSAVCVGGASMHKQVTALRRNPQVVIGTPGRLTDLIKQNILKLGGVNTLVLDEADRMFDMGFIRDIRFIVEKCPKERQSLCFSATMPTEIKNLVHSVLIDPITVSVRSGETSGQVEQDVIRAGSKEQKVALLAELLKKEDFSRVMVFGQTKWGVQRLADDLVKQGIPAEAIHGNKSQPQRQRALKAFKDGKVGVLVATDVASRGLDIPDVSHVINFDQPNTYDDYIHRIGRTGRAGKVGKALTFVSH